MATWRWPGRVGVIAVAAASSMMWGAAPAMADSVSYHLVTRIALPNTASHGDVVTFDPATNLVYAAWGGGGLAVVNAANNHLVTLVTGIGKPNGVAFNSHYVFVADGKANSLVVIDKSTWKIIDTISTTAADKTATTPDSVVYDPAHHQVFVSIDDNNTVQVYSSTAPFSLVKTINLNAEVPNSSIDNVGPDLAYLDGATNTFYESDGNYLQAYNTANFSYIGKVNTGLVLKGSNGQLVQFAGLKAPVVVGNTVFAPGNGAPPDAHTLFMVNTNLSGSVQALQLPAGVDQSVYDTQNHLVVLFASSLGGQGGFIVVNPATAQVAGTVVTGGAVHTGTVDSNNGDLYLLANGSASNPANGVLVYAPGPAPSSTPVPVSGATSPHTGVPTWPLALGALLVAAGGVSLIWGRRQPS